jgi:hypothetical protein
MRDEVYKFNIIKTNHNTFKIVNSLGEFISNKEYADVDLFNYQRHDFNPFIEYPTDVKIDFIFAVKETADWDELKEYHKVKIEDFFTSLHEVFSLIIFWFQVKRKKVQKWRYISKDAKPITRVIYDETYPFVNGIAFVKIRNKWGALDSCGKEIISIMYDKIEFVFNHTEYGEMSNFEYIKVTLGENQGIYSVKGELLIDCKYGNLCSINAEAISILKKNHSFGYGYLTEVVNQEMFKREPINEMIKLIPKLHYFVGFKNTHPRVNYLFQNIDGAYCKEVLDKKNYHSYFDFLFVSYKTGTISLVCSKHYYEIYSNGYMKKFTGYPNY